MVQHMQQETLLLILQSVSQQQHSAFKCCDGPLCVVSIAARGCQPGKGQRML